MDPSILDDKIYELEKRINKLEHQDNSEYEDNSLISLILDTFNIKRLLEMVLYSQNKVKITKNFINVALLLIFLSFIFWETGTLKCEISPSTVTLGSIFMIGLAEIANENRWIFKNRLTRKARAKKFFDNLNSMKKKEIEAEIKAQNFSSNCIDYLFREVEKNYNGYPPYLINLVIEYQYLDQNNVNLLISSSFFKNLEENTIMRFLTYKREQLTLESIQKIYETFKNEDDIIKVLIASQFSSFLIKKYPEDKRLIVYYENYYLEEKHLSLNLKLFRYILVTIEKIENFFKLFVFIISFSYYISTMYTHSTTLENLSLLTSMLVASSFITFIFDFLLFRLPYRFLYKMYIRGFINNVTKPRKGNSNMRIWNFVHEKISCVKVGKLK